MLFCIKQFMVLCEMTSIVKRKLCYHKENMMYYEEYAVDTKVCIDKCYDSLTGQKPFKLLIVAMNYVQLQLLSSFMFKIR